MNLRCAIVPADRTQNAVQMMLVLCKKLYVVAEEISWELPKRQKPLERSNRVIQAVLKRKIRTNVEAI